MSPAADRHRKPSTAKWVRYSESAWFPLQAKSICLVYTRKKNTHNARNTSEAHLIMKPDRNSPSLVWKDSGKKTHR